MPRGTKRSYEDRKREFDPVKRLVDAGSSVYAACKQTGMAPSNYYNFVRSMGGYRRPKIGTTRGFYKKKNKELKVEDDAIELHTYNGSDTAPATRVRNTTTMPVDFISDLDNDEQCFVIVTKTKNLSTILKGLQNESR